MAGNPIREYMTQSVFAVLQSALIVSGSVLTAALMRARGYPDPGQFWHPLALFVRNWGFLLISIPGAWVIGTIWLERHRGSDFTTRWTVVTGLLVLGGLAWLMVISVLLGSGAGTIISNGASH
jgi:peptidoglycan biosynthesis protein MviN/MurJ (putative lipid II flippase)